MNIEKHYRAHLLPIRILQEVTGFGRAAIHNRFARQTEWKEREIDALRVYYYPLLKELFPEYLPLTKTTQEEQQWNQTAE